jgi:hypothetical protein
MIKSPLYIAQCGEPMDGDNRAAWIAMRAAEAVAAGCTFSRVSQHPTIPSLTLFEAWASAAPSEIGEPEWQLTAA